MEDVLHPPTSIEINIPKVHSNDNCPTLFAAQGFSSLCPLLYYICVAVLVACDHAQGRMHAQASALKLVRFHRELANVCVAHLFAFARLPLPMHSHITHPCRLPVLTVF